MRQRSLFRWALSARVAALLACLSVLGCPPPPKSLPQSAGLPDVAKDGRDWFEDRAAAAGIHFSLSHHGRSPLTALETMGVGCAIFDYDGDGRADIFLVGQTGAGNGRCALYHNNGDGTFTDVTQGSGLEEPGFYTGCAVGDIDNDGRPDLLVTGYGIVRLFHNLGHGKFEDVTKGSGLEAPSPTAWATSAGFADIDHDGLLDVYIGRYVKFDPHTIQFCGFGAGDQIKSACGPDMYDPQFGSLYRNLGHLKFKDVTKEMGLDKAHGKCLGVTFADVNGDGWPDLYLGNDEMPGDLFINQGGKRFVEVAAERGVSLSEDGRPQGAMGVDFADLNRDGLLSLFVTTFEAEPDSLYAATPDGFYRNVSASMGIGPPTASYVGFGTKFVDVNNDGWLDVVIANGHVRDNEDKIDAKTHYQQPMQLFLNQEGKNFVERSQEAGPGFTTPAVGRGLAIGDLNDDGGMDILVADLEGPARLLLNRFPNRGNWLRVQLTGTTSNRMALGARVTVIAGEQKWSAECTTGGSYESASDARLHFGLGARKAVDRVEVRWPSGKRSTVLNPPIPGDLKIQEP
ncbi:MAG TPA: CRTAC1 family protein [Chthonomonadaceae bacterium]|nr:CRTAC1 family protein [Chthonomonadaceae bacterium]